MEEREKRVEKGELKEEARRCPHSTCHAGGYTYIWPYVYTSSTPTAVRPHARSHTNQANNGGPKRLVITRAYNTIYQHLVKVNLGEVNAS